MVCNTRRSISGQISIIYDGRHMWPGYPLRLPGTGCPDCGTGDAWEEVAYIHYIEAWECTSCGYLSPREQPPRECPECEATDAWEKGHLEYAEELDADDLDDDGEDEDSEEDEDGEEV